MSNYERSTEPRASFLAALKKAFPELNLDWLVSGDGRPLAPEKRIAELLSRAQGEEGLGAFSELLRHPGMQRLRALPEPAAHMMLVFLEEVRLADMGYCGYQSRAWRDFLQRFSHLYFEPFQSPRHFAPKETLSDLELINYTLALIVALRPLVLALRGRFGRSGV